MSDKIIGVVCLALSAACQVWIPHDDTALFFSWLFGVVGVTELGLGEMRQQRQPRGDK